MTAGVPVAGPNGGVLPGVWFDSANEYTVPPGVVVLNTAVFLSLFTFALKVQSALPVSHTPVVLLYLRFRTVAPTPGTTTLTGNVVIVFAGGVGVCAAGATVPGGDTGVIVSASASDGEIRPAVHIAATMIFTFVFIFTSPESNGR